MFEETKFDASFHLLYIAQSTTNEDITDHFLGTRYKEFFMGYSATFRRGRERHHSRQLKGITQNLCQRANQSLLALQGLPVPVQLWYRTFHTDNSERPSSCWHSTHYELAVLACGGCWYTGNSYFL